MAEKEINILNIKISISGIIKPIQFSFLCIHIFICAVPVSTGVKHKKVYVVHDINTKKTLLLLLGLSSSVWDGLDLYKEDLMMAFCFLGQG